MTQQAEVPQLKNDFPLPRPRAPRSGRPLRSPDQALEPEDEPVHLRRAQRHPHHRPATRPRSCSSAPTTSSPTSSPAAATCCSSAPSARPRRSSRRRPRAAGMFFVTKRWLGGTLTNFRTIKQGLERLRELERMKRRRHATSSSPRRRSQRLEKERERLEKYLGGIKNMGGCPAPCSSSTPTQGAHRGAEAQQARHPDRRASSTPTAIPT